MINGTDIDFQAQMLHRERQAVTLPRAEQRARYLRELAAERAPAAAHGLRGGHRHGIAGLTAALRRVLQVCTSRQAPTA